MTINFIISESSLPCSQTPIEKSCSSKPTNEEKNDKIVQKAFNNESQNNENYYEAVDSNTVATYKDSFPRKKLRRNQVAASLTLNH
jgi:hypothetical protein